MKFSGKGYSILPITGRAVAILGLNCADKSAIRSNNLDVKETFGRSGCYIFLSEPTESKPGRVYVGQTRYFDARFNSYKRLNSFEVVYLISRTPDNKGISRNFSEAEIQHLEFMLIDHFKELCFHRNYIFENKQSGTGTVGLPSVAADISADAVAILSTLDSSFGFPLNSKTPKRAMSLPIITSGVDHKKGGKRYRLAVERDPLNHLFKVLKTHNERPSKAIAHDNAAYWHHKQIHRRLKGSVFGPQQYSGRMVKYKGVSERKPENIYPIQKDWIAMNLSEIIGAFTNGPGPIKWYDDTGKLIDAAVIKTWKRV